MHYIYGIGVFVALLAVTEAATGQTYHTWSSTSGHSVKAAFERAESNKETSDTLLFLRKEDGQVVQVPVRLLTAESRRLALELAAKARDAQSTQPDKDALPTGNATEVNPPPKKPAATKPAPKAKSEFILDVGKNVEIRPPYRLSGEGDILYAEARGHFALLEGHVFDLRSGQDIGLLGGEGSGWRTYALSPDGRIVLMRTTTGTTSVQMLEADGKSAKQPYFFPARLEGGGLRFLDAETLIWTGPVEGLQGPHCLALNAATGEELWKYPIEGLQHSTGAWATLADKQKQIAYVDNKRIVWQELTTGKEVTTFSLDRTIIVVQLSLDGQELAAVIAEGRSSWFVVFNNRGEKVFDRPLDSQNAQRGLPIHWLPNGQGWLLGGSQLLDRRTGAIVWELVLRQTDHNAIVDDGHIITLLESKTNGYQRHYGLLPIPWQKIEPAVQIATTTGRAAFAPGMKVKLEFQVADGVEQPESVREGLERHVVARLNYHGIDLDPDATVTVHVNYVEKAPKIADPMRAAAAASYFGASPPRDAACTMRIISAAGKELWSRSYDYPAEQVSSELADIDAWRIKALDIIASRIRNGQLPVIPLGGQTTFLPAYSTYKGTEYPAR